MPRNLSAKVEMLIIVLFAFIPLFIKMPYRVNIFLSWEGAYRISKGQLPFRDFGTPLGGMFWAIPSIFLKVFGPKMISLIKAQVFINIIAGLSFRSILQSLSVDKGVRFAGVLIFVISYSFFNFWPWYNHSVIMYELVGLAFLFKYIQADQAGGVKAWRWLPLAALFIVFSFLTKQDGGGMAFCIAGFMLAVYGLPERKWKPVVIYGVSFVVLFGLIILPFLRAGFGYWFNHGQPPHTARVSPFDIADEFFSGSQWIKFYLLLTVILVILRYRSIKAFMDDRLVFLLVILTWCILGEAAVFQVTSYTPPDNNIFYHSFALPCILTLIGGLVPGVNWSKPVVAGVLTVGILVMWSSNWWKYTQRVAAKVLPSHNAAVSPTGENVVNRATYMINRDTVRDVPMDQWFECGLPSFKHIIMPKPTVDGIHRLMDMPLVKEGKGALKVLNMSELTPLAEDMPYKLEANPELPLWYHLGVGMFNKQAAIFEDRIGHRYYDLILFEYIPTLNNFYPFRTRDSLQAHYRQVDSFMAPRRGDATRGMIEVYVRPTADSAVVAQPGGPVIVPDGVSAPSK